MTPEHRALQLKMQRVDKFLYRLDEELLWYALNRMESILNHRAEEKK